MLRKQNQCVSSILKAASWNTKFNSASVNVCTRDRNNKSAKLVRSWCACSRKPVQHLSKIFVCVFFFAYSLENMYNHLRLHTTLLDKPKYKSKVVRRSQCPWGKILSAKKFWVQNNKTKVRGRMARLHDMHQVLLQMCAVFSANQGQIRHDSTALCLFI